MWKFSGRRSPPKARQAGHSRAADPVDAAQPAAYAMRELAHRQGDSGNVRQAQQPLNPPMSPTNCDKLATRLEMHGAALLGVAPRRCDARSTPVQYPQGRTMAINNATDAMWRVHSPRRLCRLPHDGGPQSTAFLQGAVRGDARQRTRRVESCSSRLSRPSPRRTRSTERSSGTEGPTQAAAHQQRRYAARYQLPRPISADPGHPGRAPTRSDELPLLVPGVGIGPTRALRLTGF